MKLLDLKKNSIPENSFAKRYAAKEACAKALGTGIDKRSFLERY